MSSFEKQYVNGNILETLSMDEITDRFLKNVQDRADALKRQGWSQRTINRLVAQTMSEIQRELKSRYPT